MQHLATGALGYDRKGYFVALAGVVGDSGYHNVNGCDKFFFED